MRSHLVDSRRQSESWFRALSTNANPHPGQEAQRTVHPGDVCRCVLHTSCAHSWWKLRRITEFGWLIPCLLLIRVLCNLPGSINSYTQKYWSTSPNYVAYETSLACCSAIQYPLVLNTHSPTLTHLLES